MPARVSCSPAGATSRCSPTPRSSWRRPKPNTAATRSSQVNADLIDGPLAHLPSGRFGAHSAWLASAAIAHNLLRAAGNLAAPHYAKSRAATIRREIIHVAARLAHRARTIHLHLPERWPWQNAFTHLFVAAHAPPA